jgi:hypothetical protein
MLVHMVVQHQRLAQSATKRPEQDFSRLAAGMEQCYSFGGCPLGLELSAGSPWVVKSLDHQKTT